jgi:SRSO17 transposase
LPFASFFVSPTRDTTASFYDYLRSLFQSERANMLRISKVNEVDHQAMQYMLTEGAVDWVGFSEQIARETNVLLGGPKSVLIFDESGFAKKGKAPAGVARQWNGRLGKVDNCQVGVFATLYRGEAASLIDTRLYFYPKTGETIRNAAKKPLSPRKLSVIKARAPWHWRCLKPPYRGGTRFGYAGIDDGYGKEPAFLRSIDRSGCRFVADVPCAQSLYLHDPEPKVPARKGRGKQPQHLKAQGASIRVAKWATEQPERAWQRLTLRDGEKGMLTAEYLHAHVWVWDGAEAKAHYWHLRVRREVGASEISHYCLANAPLNTSLKELARVQAQRFFIEHRFREAKNECGLADYQVRRWDAWHHHMALVILGTLFLLKQKIQGCQQWPLLSFNNLVTALAHLLPRRQLTAEDLAAIIDKRHRLRQRAKDSHARRAQVALE